jgi:hypothetical protein
MNQDEGRAGLLASSGAVELCGCARRAGAGAGYVYYGETDVGRPLAVVLVERGEKIRVVTAYDLDAGQKKDYLARRLRGE